MANTYLTRTPSSTGTQTKFTFSFWVKITSASNGADKAIFSSGSNSSNYYMIRFISADQLQILSKNNGSNQINYNTNQVFRDTNAWYHIVLAHDTTQSSGSRIKYYVNGEQVSSFESSVEPSASANILHVNDTTVHAWGRRNYNSDLYTDMVLSHVHFCDGYAYQASDFGSTDTTTGEWKINTAPSVTYGTNGYFILKDGNSVTDASPNSNNFTVAGGTLTKTEDCPDNVFATLNPLVRNATSANNNTLSYGNNRQTTLSVSGAYTPSPSTLGMTSGKYYAEMKVTTLVANCFVGIDGDASNTVRQGINMGYSPYGYCYAQWGGKYNNGTSVASAGATFTAGDIVGIAVDMDNLKVYFSKNGVWQNSGNPTSGSTGTGAFYTIASVDNAPDGAYFFEASNNDADGNSVWDWNFGNGYFGTTAVATNSGNGYAGAEGKSIFNYQPPTGYTALSTKGLNL